MVSMSKNKRENKKINPVRELRSLTGNVDGGISAISGFASGEKLPSAWESTAFSNGVNHKEFQEQKAEFNIVITGGGDVMIEPWSKVMDEICLKIPKKFIKGSPYCG